MTGPMDTFNHIRKAMADPAFYPHAVSGLQERETTISVVFLTGDWVYKLKKPLNLGFLDFTRLESRKYYSHQEVALNRRLAFEMYEGVDTITVESGGGFALNGSGDPVEYAVKMRQLPEGASLQSHILAGTAASGRIRDLGRYLADFYQRARSSDEISANGRWKAISAQVMENFDQTAPHAGKCFPESGWDTIRDASARFMAENRALFARRVKDGMIRDGHGDLRSEHVYFLDQIHIIDCVEFNTRYRYIDAASDMAFLFMDLESMGAMDSALEVIRAYAQAADDDRIYRMIDFYACYRAMVRFKVNCFLLEQVASDKIKKRIDLYLTLAHRYARRMNRPVLWGVCGLPASGKSTLALRLSDFYETPRLSTDEIRKENGPAGAEGSTPNAYGKGKYDLASKTSIYRKMMDAAGEMLRKNRSVVLDATFSRRKWRDMAAECAHNAGAALVFAECRADEAELARRLKKRDSAAGLSDARLRHLPEFIKNFEPLDELGEDHRVIVDTGLPENEAWQSLLAGQYAAICRQEQVPKPA